VKCDARTFKRVTHKCVVGAKFALIIHNQPNYVLFCITVVSSCHTTYAPFGSVLTTTGTGQRTGYIGREEDGEMGLGNYGVRLYEPEYGRFMSVDVLWGEYEGWQPYQYAVNAPLSFRDEGGMWVQAMNEAARDAIRNSVPAEFRSAIQFSESGVVLKEPLLAAARDQDVNSNVAILSRLAENESTMQVLVSDEFSAKILSTGKIEKFSFTEDAEIIKRDGQLVSNNDGWPLGGFTLFPEKDYSVLGLSKRLPASPTGMALAVINPHAVVSTGLTVAQTTAHELMSHIRFFLLVRMGKAYTVEHSPNRSKMNKVDSAAKRAELDATR